MVLGRVAAIMAVAMGLGPVAAAAATGLVRAVVRLGVLSCVSICLDAGKKWSD